MAGNVGQALAIATSIPTSFASLKQLDSMPGCLQQSLAVGWKGKVKAQRQQGCRTTRKAHGKGQVRCMAPELAEMEPASKGSQLLGNNFHVLSLLCTICEKIVVLTSFFILYQFFSLFILFVFELLNPPNYTHFWLFVESLVCLCLEGVLLDLKISAFGCFRTLVTLTAPEWVASLSGIFFFFALWQLW